MRKRKRKAWSKELVLLHIKIRWVQKQPLNEKSVSRQDRSLRNAANRYYGGWRQAIESAGLSYDLIRKQKSWSKKTIIEQIHARKRRGLGLNSQAVIKTQNDLYQASVTHFGGWNSAVNAAGYDYAKESKIIHIRWTTHAVLQAIRHRKALGKSLSFTAVERDERILMRVAQRKFGSWSKAVEASGVDYSTVRLLKTWSRESIIAAIRRRVEDGDPVSNREVRRDDVKLFAAARDHFGSWKNAVEAAGLSYEHVRKHRSWNPSLVITEIRLRLLKGESIRYKKVKNESLQLFSAAVRHFDSWGYAVEAAGIPYAEYRKRRWSRSCVLCAIRAAADSGLPLNSSAVIERDAPLYSSATYHFGSWELAVKEAGLNYDAIRVYARWSESDVIISIIERQARGTPLSAGFMNRNDSALYGAARKHFGTWEKAIEAAGLSYDAIVRRWIFKRRKSSMRRFVGSSRKK